MSSQSNIQTFSTRLDSILGGGIPSGSFQVVAGTPGTGKTIFVQQWLFHFLKQTPGAKTLYLTTLSEPPAKSIRFMREFDYFEPGLFQSRFELDDIGSDIRGSSLDEIRDRIIKRVQASRPAIVVVDSFKALRDLSADAEAFRHFVYQFAVHLHTLNCTTVLVGEYTETELLDGAEFAVADGIIAFRTVERSGEYQRSLQILKMRGRNPVQRPVPFWIARSGIEVQYAPGEIEAQAHRESESRQLTGIGGLDEMTVGGFPVGRAVLVSGISGTGKTTLALNIAANAVAGGRRVLYFSYEESVSDLIITASSFGWNLREAITDGRIRISHTPQTEIAIERDIARMGQEISSYQPAWVVIDSVSVLLYRVLEPGQYREKVYELKRLLLMSNATGLFLSDIPASEPGRLSHMGVEETVADGVIALTSSLQAGERRRHIEVYKMRRTAHVKGEVRFSIGSRGIEVHYRTRPLTKVADVDRRLSYSLIAPLLDGALRYDSTWLVRGEPGTGKSTMAMHFAAEGLQAGESAIIVTADAPGSDIERRLSLIGVDVAALQSEGRLRILDSYSGQDPNLALSELTLLLYSIDRFVNEMRPPVRIVFDSITPLSVFHDTQKFVRMVYEKNRALRRPDVAIFDTHLYQRGSPGTSLLLINGYDIVIDLFAAPDSTPGGARYLQIAKVRDVGMDGSPQAYHVDADRGMVLSDGG